MTNPNDERNTIRRTPLHSDILNSPGMQLQRSLAAQQALMKSSVSIPDLTAALTPPSVRIFQNIQKKIAVQKSITSKLADTSFALRTAQNRILAEVQTVVAARDALNKQFRQVTEATAAIRQVFTGNVLPEIRSILAARESFASQVRDHLQAVTKAKAQVSSDVLSSIRAATAARTAISQQLQDTVRAASTFRTHAVPRLQAVVNRLSALPLDELGRLAEELEARDSLFAAWSAEGSAALADQLEADIAAHPEACEWSVEDQISYLIGWTQKQDNSQFKQAMLSLLINLIAASIFWFSVEVVPGLLMETSETPPKITIVIRDVRERIEEQPLPSDDLVRLRIVSRRFAPVRASRRRRSARIATLYAGEVVHVCEKRGKWVWVEWTDLETGQTCDGWMLSKHLTRVRKSR